MDKFSLAENGYNKEEVNKFVDDVIAQTEAVINRIKEQQRKNKSLEKELEVYKNMERSLNTTFLRAEEAANNLRQNAVVESKNIIAEAKTNASRIINDASLRAEKIEIKADTLERNVITFKRKLKLIIEQQQSIVEDIDELDLK